MMTTYRWKWVQLWEQGQYTLEFVSPHSLETCAKILRDQSRRGYFEYGGRDFLHPDLKNRGVFVDVNTETPYQYTFRMEKEFGDSLRQRAFLEATGTLTRVRDGTRVEATIRRGGAWGIIVMGVCFLWLMIFCQSITPPITAPIGILLLVWLQPVIWGGWFWRMRLHPFIQFVESLEKWLGEPSTPIRHALTPIQHPFQAKFDFYTSDSITTCVEKLTQKSDTRHYQPTHLGMKHGIGVNGELFIVHEAETGERQYLLIERNMWLAHSSLYNSPVRVLGTLETEDDMTHVYGYSYLPRGWWYVSLFMAVWTILLISAIAWSPIMLLLGMGIGVVMYAILNSRVQNMNGYPQIIQSSVRAQNRFDWMRLRYSFDFHSPYPPVECVNMLLDYSPAREYPSQWGVKKEVILGNGFRVITTEIDPNSFDFSVELLSPASALEQILPSGMKPRLLFQSRWSLNQTSNSQGTLRAEGYGTRVSGCSRKSRLRFTLLLFILYGLGFITLISPALFTSVLAPVVFIYILMSLASFISFLHSPSPITEKYIKNVLSGKGGRKGKEKQAHDD